MSSQDTIQASYRLMEDAINVVASREGHQETARVALGTFVGVLTAIYGLTEAQRVHAEKALFDTAEACGNAAKEYRKAAGQ